MISLKGNGYKDNASNKVRVRSGGYGARLEALNDQSAEASLARCCANP